MEEKIQAMRELLEEALRDYRKSTIGNKSAAVRVRGTMSRITKIAKEVRIDVLASMKEGK